MTPAGTILLLAAGAAAGIVGSAGGTASLISYPALLAVGLPPLTANVTNAVAFVAAWPCSALGSRTELRGQGHWLRRQAPLAVAGSAAGAVLLLVTPGQVFDRVVPFLLALAALALLLQPQATKWLGSRPAGRPRPAHDHHRPSARPGQRAEEHAARHRRRGLLRRIHPVLARRLGGRHPDGSRPPGRRRDRAVGHQARPPARPA